MKSKQLSMASTRAFTLVELLVVIAIIGLLTGIIMTNLFSSKSKARDAKRISDMGQIQLSLELYFDRCKEYPAQANGSNAIDLTATCPTNNTVVLSNYMTTKPTPPAGFGSTDYDYYVNSTVAGSRTNYYLHTVLESNNAALQDAPSGSGISIGSNTVDCSHPSNGPFNYCVVPQ